MWPLYLALLLFFCIWMDEMQLLTFRCISRLVWSPLSMSICVSPCIYMCVWLQVCFVSVVGRGVFCRWSSTASVELSHSALYNSWWWVAAVMRTWPLCLVWCTLHLLMPFNSRRTLSRFTALTISSSVAVFSVNTVKRLCRLHTVS